MSHTFGGLRNTEYSGGRGIGMTFKTEILIYHPKANLDVKFLFGKITDHLDWEIQTMLVMGSFRNQNCMFDSDPWFTYH